MTSKRPAMLIALWLVLSGVLALFVMAGGRLVMQDSAAQQVRQHLLLTLDEAYFSSAEGAFNDVHGLRSSAQRINTAFRHLVRTHWYSAHRDCQVALRQIDEVAIGEQTVDPNLWLSLPRNQIDRSVGLSMVCSANPVLPAAVSVLLGLLFLMIGRFLPPPLSGRQRTWIALLAEQGYPDEEAVTLVSQLEDIQLELAPSQLACFERLHEPRKRNAMAVLQQVSRREVAALTGAQIDWYVLGLSEHALDTDAALALATAPDSVSIDLGAMRLQLRGLAIPTSGTPLFYYAWYARQRLDGDGWVTNPASNRPDLAVGQEIAQFMASHNGHGRAINDLQQAGLKARTLDQNRSKIKDDIVAVLGEKLAENYLFETSKHPDGIHTRYRLRAPASVIEVLG